MWFNAFSITTYIKTKRLLLVIFLYLPYVANYSNYFVTKPKYNREYLVAAHVTKSPRYSACRKIFSGTIYELIFKYFN